LYMHRRRRASKLQSSRRPRWLPLRVPLTQRSCRPTCGVRGASLMTKSSGARAAEGRCAPGAPLTSYGRAGLWRSACTKRACAWAGTTAACSIRWQQVRGRCSPAVDTARSYRSSTGLLNDRKPGCLAHWFWAGHFQTRQRIWGLEKSKKYPV